MMAARTGPEVGLDIRGRGRRWVRDSRLAAMAGMMQRGKGVAGSASA